MKNQKLHLMHNCDVCLGLVDHYFAITPCVRKQELISLGSLSLSPASRLYSLCKWFQLDMPLCDSYGAPEEEITRCPRGTHCEGLTALSFKRLFSMFKEHWARES